MECLPPVRGLPGPYRRITINAGADQYTYGFWRMRGGRSRARGTGRAGAAEGAAAGVKLTNLGKVMYPDLGVTKGQVIEYYNGVAPRMLGMLKGRALALKRFPEGIGGGGFFEQNAPRKVPPWVRTFRRRSGGERGGGGNQPPGRR